LEQSGLPRIAAALGMRVLRVGPLPLTAWLAQLPSTAAARSPSTCWPMSKVLGGVESEAAERSSQHEWLADGLGFGVQFRSMWGQQRQCISQLSAYRCFLVPHGRHGYSTLHQIRATCAHERARLYSVARKHQTRRCLPRCIASGSDAVLVLFHVSLCISRSAESWQVGPVLCKIG